MPEDVPFLDLDRAIEQIRCEVESAVLEVLRDGRFVLGPHVDAFEKEWGAYLRGAPLAGESADKADEVAHLRGAPLAGESADKADEVAHLRGAPLAGESADKAEEVTHLRGAPLAGEGAEKPVHVIGVSSGTAALFVSLMALEIGPGHEVITTPFTFASPVEAICRLGATPVFVDVDPDTYLLDLDQVKAAITPRTRAILPVHLFGRCVDLMRLRALCDQHGLALVEDAAQAHGARSNGLVAGTVGEFGCFSFYPTKNLGAAGDAGAVVTRDETLAQKAKMIARHGSRQKYRHEVLGQNERLDAIQAAVLRVKLPRLDLWNLERRRIAARYRELLDGVVALPPDGPGDVYHHFVCRVPNRDDVRAELTQKGIGTGIYYPQPLHTQPAFRAHLAAPVSLPAAESLAHEALALPCFPGLRDDEIGRVCEQLIANIS